MGVAELGRLLRDLGLLEGKPAAETPGYVVAQFAAADKDRDNALDYQEFTNYYLAVSAAAARWRPTLACWQATPRERQSLPIPLPSLFR